MTKPKDLKSPQNANDKKNWQDLPLGGVITSAGNSAEHYHTNNWSKQVCHWDPKTCINCNLCWPVCPDDAIKVDAEGNMIGIDEQKCKACGLCVTACPTQPKSLKLATKKDQDI